LIHWFFFNDSFDRALLFLQLQRNVNCNCTDNVKLISAEKIDNVWHFYSSGNPYFNFIITEGRITRYSFNELSEMTIKRMMIDGLIEKSNTCKVNNKYVSEKWFPEKRKKYHWIFLNNQY
jgi:hypothetical protein